MIVAETEIIISKDGVELSRNVVPPGDYIIGRDSECDISLDVELVSRQHALLVVHHDHALIEDLDSRNGTFVNGKLVSARMRLWPNQRITVGLATIELRRVKTESGQDHSLAPHEAMRHKFLPEEFLREKKYEIGGVVAQGGMGAILDAREATTGRTVAMKVMLDSTSRDYVARFITEARITAQLEHPNIVPVHELSVDANDQIFYTMKFVQGSTLRAILVKLREGDAATLAKYPLTALLTAFQKVCDALGFAHSKGIIHRDLKPDNVMLGDYGEVLVMDWGLAKVLPREVVDSQEISEQQDAAELSSDPPTPDSGFVTMAGAVMGTPQYMSPEQARGEIKDLDPRSDIYALGAILYQILTLQPPVRGKSAQEVLAKVASGDIELELVGHDGSATRAAGEPVAGQLVPIRLPHLPGERVPESLGAVCRKAMAFEREARYKHVTELQRDITAYQAGFATSAESAGNWKHFTLFLARHKAVSVSVAAALLILAVVSAGFTVSVIMERNRALASEGRTAQALAAVEPERKRAETERARAETERNLAQKALIETAQERNRAEKALADYKSEHSRADAESNRASKALVDVKTQNNRAEQALAALKQTAPAFQNLAQSLLNEGKFGEALEKVGYAIQLDDENPAYRLFHAHLLESSQHLPEAIAEYRRVLALRRDDASAKANLALCQQLLSENGNSPTLTKPLQKRLLSVLREQRRLIEAAPLSALLEPDLAIIQASLQARLQEYRQQAQWDDNRLSLLPDGSYKLVLDHLRIGDLSIFRGLPISSLSLAYTEVSDLRSVDGIPLMDLNLLWTSVKDLSPLRSLPLQSLNIQNTPVTTLEPLAGMKLHRLVVNQTLISNLDPIAGAPLNYFSADNSLVTDLSPLRGAPLIHVSISACPIDNLAPLAAMPLQYLDISYNDRIHNFQSLVNFRQLQDLFIQHTDLKDTTFLKDIPALRIHH